MPHGLRGSGPKKEEFKQVSLPILDRSPSPAAADSRMNAYSVVSRLSQLVLFDPLAGGA